MLWTEELWGSGGHTRNDLNAISEALGVVERVQGHVGHVVLADVDPQLFVNGRHEFEIVLLARF